MTGGVVLQPVAENRIVALYGKLYYASGYMPEGQKFVCDLYELECRPVMAAKEKVKNVRPA